MVSAKISRELDRENLIVRNIIKEISSDKYVKLEELPKNYSLEQAQKDNCIIIKDNVVIDNGKNELQAFIENTQNQKEDYVRIVTYSLINDEQDTIIIDIQYINNEYILYMDTTRASVGEKSIRYIGAFQSVETKPLSVASNNYTALCIKDLLGEHALAIFY